MLGADLSGRPDKGAHEGAPLQNRNHRAARGRRRLNGVHGTPYVDGTPKQELRDKGRPQAGAWEREPR